MDNNNINSEIVNNSAATTVATANDNANITVNNTLDDLSLADLDTLTELLPLHNNNEPNNPSIDSLQSGNNVMIGSLLGEINKNIFDFTVGGPSLGNSVASTEINGNNCYPTVSRQGDFTLGSPINGVYCSFQQSLTSPPLRSSTPSIDSMSTDTDILSTPSSTTSSHSSNASAFQWDSNLRDVRECLNNETDQYFELLSQNTTQSFLQNHRVSVEEFINSDYEISEAIDKTLAKFVNE